MIEYVRISIFSCSASFDACEDGRLEDDGRIGCRGDLDLALPGSDRLDQHEVESGRIEHRGRGGRGRSESAGVPTRRHRTDEDVAVVRVRLHPHAVAEQRAAGDRR